jgi:hypothetical protein
MLRMRHDLLAVDVVPHHYAVLDHYAPYWLIRSIAIFLRLFAASLGEAQ